MSLHKLADGSVNITPADLPSAGQQTAPPTNTLGYNNLIHSDLTEEAYYLNKRVSTNEPEADLCGQISTKNSLSKYRKPLADDVNDKDNLDTQYSDEESFQEVQTDF